MTSGARVTARLAMSLDGYIADPDGGFDWIQPDVDDHLDTSHQLFGHLRQGAAKARAPVGAAG